MKYCPNCAEANYDDSAACWACGQPLPYSPPPAEDDLPTQPLHAQPQHTQPRPAQPGYPDPRGAYPPQQPQGPYQGYQPNTPQGQTQYGYAQPGAQQQAYPPPGYQGQPYQPPYPPQPTGGLRRAWPALALGALALLCLCGATFWLLSGVGRGGNRLGNQFATQVAAVLPGGEEVRPDPDGPATIPDPFNSPTPWPTFTAAPPEPTFTPEPSLTPEPQADPTEVALTEKLLSPECKSALDTLGRLGGEISNEPFKLLDAEWREQFEFAQAETRLRCGSIDAASPVPAQLQAVQQNLALANSAYEDANRLWREAIDSRDPTKVFEAAGQFQQATRHLNQAITELRRVVP